jgi:uncharacterized lipoprotein YajG
MLPPLERPGSAKYRRRMLRRLALAVLLAAVGCASSVDLVYGPPPAALPSGASVPVALGSFADARQNPPRRLGVVRGGYGNVLKRVNTRRPVAELVRDAFGEGLRARGLLGGKDAVLTLEGRIEKLDCNLYFSREAHSRIEVSLVDARGRERFRKTYAEDREEGTGAVGAFGSTEGLRRVAAEVLTATIDQALDDPEFRAALRGQPQATGATDARERLRELRFLHDQGLITDEEYQTKRREILDAL